MEEGSPSKRLTLGIATLNMYLEEVCQVTLRSSQGSTYLYVGDEYGEVLNSSNISAVVFEKINRSSSELTNAVSYLYGCYRRMVGKESTAPQNCRDELLK